MTDLTNSEDRTKQAPQVLLVEDLADTVVGLTLDLEYRGASVYHATTRTSAELMLSESHFSAILIDLNIPERTDEEPSPEHGRALVKMICRGDFDLNTESHVVIITAQKIDLRPNEFANCSQFAGIGSKIGDSRWLLRLLSDLGIGSGRTDLDADMIEPQRARVQLVFGGFEGDDILFEAPDLDFGRFSVPRRLLTDGLRTKLSRRSPPVAMWASGNVAAESPDRLDLREFEIGDEQVSRSRDYTWPDWLRVPRSDR